MKRSPFGSRGLLGGFCLLFLIGFLTPLQSSNTTSVTLFGPETFMRTAGRPITETRVVSAPSLPRILNGSWSLRLANGQDKATRIASGKIFWNSTPLIRQQDLNKNVTEIVRPINLQESNQLVVVLESQPNAFVKVEIKGDVALPPPPTLEAVATPTSEPAQTLRGQGEPGTTIEVNVNGEVFTTTTDATGAFAIAISLREGENPVSVREVDPLGLKGPAVSVTIVLSTGPKGVVIGQVFNSQTETPLAGALITSLDHSAKVFSDGDGKFRYEVSQSGIYRIKVEKEGFTFVQRRVPVELGQETTVGKIYLLVQDTQVTEIGPAGGIHQNSKGTIEVQVPAGALAATIPVQTTQYEKDRELPSPLPDTSFFTYAANFEPDGVVFAEPVVIRIANALGFSPGTAIPVGVWNQERLKWEHGALARVTDDGQWAEYTIEHFSPHDINLPAQIPGVVGFPDVIEPQISLDTSKQSYDCVGSAVAKQNGELIQNYQTPAYKSLGVSRFLEFLYDSGTAGNQLPLTIHRGFDDFSNSTPPDEVRVTMQFASEKKTIRYEGSNGTIRVGTTFSMKDSTGQPLATGVYPYESVLEHGYDGATFGSTSCFGCDVETPTSVAFPQRLFFTTEQSGKVLVENNQNSPFGHGWRIANLQRLYSANGDVLLIEEGGGRILFEGGKKLETTVGTGEAGFSGDDLLATEARISRPTDIDFSPATGELYIADDGNRRIRKVSADGFITTVAGGGSDPNSENIFATAALLGNITGIGFDLDGNLYLAERDRARIRRVGLDGLIQTVYAGPNEGIFDVAVDAEGDIIWSDENNHKIRKKNALGEVSDLVRGRGPLFLYGDRPLSTDLKLSFPRGISISESGEMLFAHATSNIPFSGVWRLDNGKILRRIAGTFETLGYAGEGLTARQAHIANPSYVVEDASGNVYFSEDGVGLRKVDTRGILKTEAGFPRGTRVDANGIGISPGGEVFFADRGGSVIRRMASFVEGEARELSAPAGEFSSLIQDADGTYLRTYKDGREVRFNAQGLQTESRDRNGTTTTYEYDSQGRLVRVTDPVGLITRLFYSGEKLSEVQDPAGRITQFNFDANGDLISIVSPAGEEVHYTYDASHRMVSSVDAAGRLVEYVYDNKGAAKEIRYPTGEVRKVKPFLFEGVVANPDETLNSVALVDNTPQQLTDGRGGVTTAKLDDEGLETQIKDPLGRVTAVTRNTDHLPVGVVRPDASHIDLSYDKKGNPTRLQLADGGLSTSMVFTYEPVFNQIKSIKDPNNRQTFFEYDTHGNLIKITNALSEQTRAAYNSLGLVTAITDAFGRMTTFSYNAEGNLASTTDPLGNTTSFSYDAAGNIISTTDAEGNTTRFSYDAQNRLTSVQDASEGMTTYSYAQSGCGCVGQDLVTSITDSMGNTTQFEYDAVGNLIAVTDPKGNVETREYDLNRNLVAVMDRNGTRITFDYDLANQLTQVGKPEETVTFAYNVLGSITTAANSATTLNLNYDGLNRLSRVLSSHVAGADVRYTYDRAGNVTQTKGPQGTILTTRDALNRVAQVQVGAGFTFDIFFMDYDAVGNRTSSFHQLTELQENRKYDPAGRLTQWLNKKGFSATAPVLSQFDYTYDAVGNRTSQRDSFGTHNFTYDSVYRLLGVDDPLESFTYDSVGNRLSSVEGPANLAYTYNENNQITTITKDGAPYASFTYDNNGNTLTKTINGETTTFSWDSENRLVQVDTPTETAEYAYDPFGRRIEKVVGATIKRYVYDREDIVSEYDSSNVLQASYIHGPDIDEPLQMKRGGVTYFYQRDALGSIASLSDASGNKVMTYRYDSFGNVVNETGTIENPYIYTGRERDAETGLYYYRARYYDAQLGRFLSEDPLRHDSGINLFIYVNNNPIKWIDPWGLSSATFDSATDTVTVYDKNGNIIGVYSAGNYTINPTGDPYVVGSGGPAPRDTFPVQPPVSTRGRPEFGPYFWPIGAVGSGGERLDIARQRGIGLHCGRRGPQSPTEGCIRMHNFDCIKLYNATQSDPLTEINIR